MKVYRQNVQRLLGICTAASKQRVIKNPRWQKLSRVFLKQNDQCERYRINKRMVAAVEVDLVLPVRKFDHLKYDQSNLQTLCHSCHSTKTSHERQGNTSWIDTDTWNACKSDWQASLLEEGKQLVCVDCTIAHEELLDRLKSVRQDQWIMSAGLDPYNASMFTKELERWRIQPVMITQHIRSLNATTKLVRDLVIRRRLHHRGNEFLNW